MRHDNVTEILNYLVTVMCIHNESTVLGKVIFLSLPYGRQLA